jgi:membrane protease YdiL (CAAX protease family)
MVWAAWHFSTDFSKIQHVSSVLAQLVLRITLCVGMGLVLGWLTMRTHSILPATLAHAIYDAFAGLRLTEWKLGQSLLINFSWGLLAYFLFRYWPVGGEAGRPGHSTDLGTQAMLQV